MAYFQTDTLWIKRLADGVAALVFDLPGRSTNLLTRQALDDLGRALERVTSDGAFHLLVLRSGKEASFCHGLDLDEIAGWSSADEARRVADAGQNLCRRLQDLPMPTVAIIGGGCLGAGLELALACDYRVVLDKPGTLLGFTEPELGLIPSWGGIHRLMHTVGLERTLPMLLGGKRLSAREAFAWGLVDDLTEELDERPPAFLAQPHKRIARSLPRRTWRQKILESNAVGRWLILRGAERVLQRKLPADFPAPHEALQVIRTILKQGPAAELELAQTTLARLAQSEAHRNLLRLARARQNNRPPQRYPLHRLGLVGGGTRGTALAHWAVARGCQAVLREASETALGMAMFGLVTLFQQAVVRGSISQKDFTRCMGGVHGTTAWKGFHNLELVIESAAEDPAGKPDLFLDMEKNTGLSAILVSTSPAVNLAAVQKEMKHPERVAALHFLPPVDGQGPVEVVAGPATDERTVRTLCDWLRAAGKMPIRVPDRPGFLILRVWLPYLNEAILLVRQGLRPERIDQVMSRFGMAWGPFEFMDRIGLDRLAAVAEVLQPNLAGHLTFDPAFTAMKPGGPLGSKSGGAFYVHRRGRAQVNRQAIQFLQATPPSQGLLQPMSRSDQERLIQERLVPATVNEAARCLAEGLAPDAAALDLAMMLSGWAPHRGGPLHYADHAGNAASSTVAFP